MIYDTKRIVEYKCIANYIFDVPTSVAIITMFLNIILSKYISLIYKIHWKNILRINYLCIFDTTEYSMKLNFYFYLQTLEFKIKRIMFMELFIKINLGTFFQCFSPCVFNVVCENTCILFHLKSLRRWILMSSHLFRLLPTCKKMLMMIYSLFSLHYNLNIKNISISFN